jgi:hypothetical protein
VGRGAVDGGAVDGGAVDGGAVDDGVVDDGPAARRRAYSASNTATSSVTVPPTRAVSASRSAAVVP